MTYRAESREVNCIICCVIKRYHYYLSENVIATTELFIIEKLSNKHYGLFHTHIYICFEEKVHIVPCWMYFPMIEAENSRFHINISKDALKFVVDGGRLSFFTFIIVELKIDVDEFVNQNGFVETKLLTQWNNV